MTGPMDLELLRLLRGELPPEEARRLRARLLREPELAEAYHRLERSWQALEPPPAAPVPPGFSTRVMAHVRATRASAPARESWASAPGWVRATAAAALVTGIVAGWAGAGAGSFRPAPVSVPTPVPVPVAVETAIPAAPDSPPVSVEETATPERPPETAPAPPVIAVLPAESGDAGEETLFDWDGDLADSYWEAVASLSASEAGAAEEPDETGGALP